MHTPWGELQIADAHVHFFSHRFFELLGKQVNGSPQPEELATQLGWQCPPVKAIDLGRHWAAELTHHGVDRAALIASLPGDESSVAEAVASFPDRFTGFFMVNPTAPAALDTLRLSLKSGLTGAAFFPAMHRYSINDERVTPLLDELASQANTVAFVHCGALSVGVRKKLGIPSPFDMRYSNPVDLHPLALRYPKLPFIVPHFGAGYFREALMLADLCENVCFDTSSSNSWVRYQPNEPDLTTVFRRALGVLGPKRLLFGTDSSFFPRGWHKAIFDQQVEALWQAGVQKSDAELILGGNFRRLTRERAAAGNAT